MRVDGARLDVVRHLPHLGQDPVARDHRAAVADQQHQQLVFFFRQPHFFGAGVNAVRVLVDAQLAVVVLGRLQRTAAAAEDGADAGHQLPHAERLGQVVVRAELQTGDAVALRAARGEHEDGNRPGGLVAPQLAADGQPVEVGKVDIEDDEVALALLHRQQTFLAAGVVRNLIPLALQVQFDGERDVGVVFDERDPFHSRPACLMIFPSTR